MAGQKIKDRGSWAGNGMANGVKKKEYSGAMGAGDLERYEDTEEQIVAAQKEGVAKLKRHGPKAHYRE